jgi:MbtH protein
VNEERVDETRYTVVINHEEQYSIWPDDGRDLPDGWSAAGKSGSREECLAHIGEVWIDMTPKSVRERIAAARD